MAATQRVELDSSTTWTVVSKSLTVVEAVESYLEYGRQRGFKPNTVKAYARGLAQWWTYLERTGKRWDTVQIHDFGNFLAAVRHDEFDPTVRQLQPAAVVVEATVSLRLRAVMGFYRYHAAYGIDVAPFLYEQVRGRSGRYLSFLEHVARRAPQRRAAIRVRVPRHETPILTPAEIDTLLDAEATYSPTAGEWRGDLRYRLLWSVLAETGMRIGEALSLQHRDWRPADRLPLRCRSLTGPTHTGSRPNRDPDVCTSAAGWTGSTAITCGGCAIAAPTR
jgi:integrase